MIDARTVLVIVSALGVLALLGGTGSAVAQSQHMEVIHHPNYDRTVFMPFVPAVKIKSGKLLWLAGTTALPVYHDHPHKRDEIQKYMVNDLEAQTRAAMEGIKRTLEAAGASFKDVVHIFVFRGPSADGRHRTGLGGDQLVLRAVQPQADLDEPRRAGAGRARAAHRDPGGGRRGLSLGASWAPGRSAELHQGQRGASQEPVGVGQRLDELEVVVGLPDDEGVQLARLPHGFGELA
jgi:enamine deaminase RidA (YjgF/YER057c/UK114 family)